MGREESGRILVVDDQTSICYALKRFLTAEGYDVATAASAREALRIVQDTPPDVIVMDVSMPGMDGLEALVRLKESHPKIQIVLMTAFSSTERAISAMKQGAFDFLLKPFDNDHLLKVVKDALASQRMQAEIAIPNDGRNDSAEEQLIGKSPKMLEVFKQIGKVAATEAPVLILGETGTGKELVARAICQHSRRARKPFLAINCAAIPENLLETELFGHEKGAFTGAAVRRPGKFEQCHGGTLFLDEIGDLPLTLQGKLLRVLQDGSFQRVGGNETLYADVRVIAATHCNLETMVAQNTFREDLFYRINVITISLPPLRERPEDIENLTAYFLQKYNRLLGKDIHSLCSGTLEQMKSYSWPGNVRELENVVQKAMVLASGDCLTIPFLADRQVGNHSRPAASCEEALNAFVDRLFASGLPCALPEIVQQLETLVIARALELTNNNQVQAARLLGIARNTLRKKISPPAN